MKPILKALGAGSRGGKVIGRTKSGKPVYAKKQAKVARSKITPEIRAKTAAYLKPKSTKPKPAVTPVHINRHKGEPRNHTTSGHTEHGVPIHVHDSIAGIHNVPHIKSALEHIGKQYPHPDTDIRVKPAWKKDGSLKHVGVHVKTQAGTATMKQSHLIHPDPITKATTAANQENNMGNELEEIFKSELGGTTEKVITTCVHCAEGLTKSQLEKGLGTHFIKDDNDQPHSKGNTAPSRAGAAAKENDPVGGLLKGQSHGDKEEFVISKSEMEAMGMDASDTSGADMYKITKGELTRLGAGEHESYLRHKTLLFKGCDSEDMGEEGGEEEEGEGKPDLQKMKKGKLAKSTAVGPSGVAAGVAHTPGGNPLVNWFPGDDEAIAKSIEQGGRLGQGSDEPIKNSNTGLG